MSATLQISTVAAESASSTCLGSDSSPPFLQRSKGEEQTDSSSLRYSCWLMYQNLVVADSPVWLMHQWGWVAALFLWCSFVAVGMAEHEAEHVFVYGKLRPDAPDNTDPLAFVSGARKAYLMGGRLYCFDKGGRQSAAVRLEEAGHSVTGYVVKASGAVSALLQESETKEYSPQVYERDVVEVVTEKGERVSSYIYHIPDVEVSNPVPKGDWLQRSH